MNPPEEATPIIEAAMDEDDLASAVGQYRIDHPSPAPLPTPRTRAVWEKLLREGKAAIAGCSAFYKLGMELELAQLRRQVIEAKQVVRDEFNQRGIGGGIQGTITHYCEKRKALVSDPMTWEADVMFLLDAALAAERAATIEQCAKVADAWDMVPGCAAAIRALGNTDGGSNG